MHEVSSRDVSFVFDLDLWTWPRIWTFRMTFELRPWIKTTFSGRHKGESVFTRSYLPLNHGFHESEKITFSSSKMQKMSSHEARYPWTWVSRLGSRCIFRAPKCTKWSYAMCRSCLTLPFDPGHEFGLFALPLNIDLEIKLSHFKVAIKEKMCSHEATNSCSMGFTTRQKSHFQAAKMQKMSSHEARYPWTWVSRLGSKCIFRAPKCTKWAHAMCRSCLTLPFYPGHEFGLFAGPWIKTNTFSGRHKGENVFTRSYVPLKHGFHDSEKNHIFKPPKCRKWVWTKIGTLEREFQDSAVNVFSGRQNAWSELTRCVIRVLPWPLTLAANLVFSHDHEFKLSHFQVAIKEKSYELL